MHPVPDDWDQPQRADTENEAHRKNEGPRLLRPVSNRQPEWGARLGDGGNFALHHLAAPTNRSTLEPSNASHSNDSNNRPRPSCTEANAAARSSHTAINSSTPPKALATPGKCATLTLRR